MNGVQYALRQINLGEQAMHEQLCRLAEQHRAEHEVHHVARDLAAWSQENVHAIAARATRLGLDLDTGADAGGPATVATRTGAGDDPGLQLLHDLAEVYLRAADNSLSWEMLAQVAQAKREAELLALTQHCHPQTLRQMRWANTMIKTQSPQILGSL